MKVTPSILKEFSKAERCYKTAEHLALVGFPVIRDPKLLLRSMENLNKCLISVISVVLKYEHLNGNLKLSKDSNKNLKIFFRKFSSVYGLNKKDNILVNELFLLYKQYKESDFDFSKKDKFVILDNKLGFLELDVGKLGKFLTVSKKLLNNTNIKISGFI